MMYVQNLKKMKLEWMKSFLGGDFLFDLFDDTDGNGLFHVSDGESSQRRIFIEWFDAHGFAGNQDGHAAVISLDEFGFFFKNFACSSVNFAL